MDKTMLEKLRAEKERLTKKGGQQIDFEKVNFKPKMGTNKIRILPPKGDAEFFYVTFGQHWINRKPVNCPKYTHGEDCPICEYVSKLYDSGSEDDKALARNIKASKRAAINVIDRNNEDEGAKVYEMSQTFLSTVIDYFLDDDYGDLTDPEEGFDFKLIKDTGENGQVTYVKSRPDRKPTSVDEETMETWLESAKDLTEWCITNRNKTYEEIEKFLHDQLAIDTSINDEDTDDSPASAEDIDQEDLLEKIRSRIKE